MFFALAAICASGAFFILSAPSFGAPLLAWIAFIPLLFAMSRLSFFPFLASTLLTGALYYCVAFSWVGTFHRFALPFAAFAYAPFFFALPLLCARPFIRTPRLFAWAFPSIWVFFEFLKETGFLRFPFGMLGYSQFSNFHLIQISELGGVELVSWLIAFANARVFLALDSLLLARKASAGDAGTRHGIRECIRHVAAAAVCLAAAFAWGYARVPTLEFAREPVLKVGFAQTLFHPRKVWLEHQDEYLATIDRLSAGLGAVNCDLALFPELTIDRAMTFDPNIRLEGNAEILNRLSFLARENRMVILAGALEAGIVDGKTATRNTMFQFSPSGDLTGLYRKRYPVPFGEANPFRSVAPALGSYLGATTDAVELTPGTDAPLFSVTNPKGTAYRYGVLICFEGTFGSPAREYVRNGADFLVNATSDYWALSPIASTQHAIMSLFRAIETRTPVLRISNGGISCYVDETGKYSTQLSLFTEGLMVSRLYLLKSRPETIFVRFGNWVPAICALIVAICVIAKIIQGKERLHEKVKSRHRAMRKL